MKNLENTHYVWRLTKLTINLSLLFWGLETIVFLIKYGWHTEATHVDEITCDYIANTGFKISLFLIFLVVFNVIEYLLDSKEE